MTEFLESLSKIPHYKPIFVNLDLSDEEWMDRRIHQLVDPITNACINLSQVQIKEEKDEVEEEAEPPEEQDHEEHMSETNAKDENDEEENEQNSDGEENPEGNEEDEEGKNERKSKKRKKVPEFVTLFKKSKVETISEEVHAR